MHLRSFKDFVKAVSAHSHRHGIAWRGQMDAKWRLVSSAFNAERFRIPLYAEITHRADHASDILWLALAVETRIKDSGRSAQKALGSDAHLRLLLRDELADRDIHNKPHEYDELLSICQHFGMKTPLLDMTDSPYIALYFAAYDALTKETHQWRGDNRVAVWQVPAHFWNPTVERPTFTYALTNQLVGEQVWRRQDELLANAGELEDGKQAFKVTIENVFPRIYSNDRLVAQQGSFVRVTPDLPLDHVVSMIGTGHPGGAYEPLTEHLIQYTLPARFALDYLVQLKKMNVRHETLFPDLVGQMNAINLAMDHYDYAGQGHKGDRGSMFDLYHDRHDDFWV